MSENDLTERDVEIIKHREAHFSGSFPVMLAYYQSAKPGKDPEFTLERIIALEQLEKSSGINFASLLPEEDQDEIEHAKKFYKRLKAKKDAISALLLSEEETPKEIEQIVSLGKKAVPLLIALMQNEDLKNPLFPGYGRAGTLAVDALRRIKDDSAIIALFEEIGHEEVVDEEGALLALKAIGRPAMEFLLKVVASHPITEDNERAAIALIHFKDEQGVAEKALSLLEKEEAFRKSTPLSSYMVLIAADVNYRERLITLAKTSPPFLKKEIELIVKTLIIT